MLVKKTTDIRLNCDTIFVLLWSDINEVVKCLLQKMASWAERLSVFAAVASEVAVRLVSRYEKNVRRIKWRILVIFLYFCEFSLTTYGWRKKEERKKEEEEEEEEEEEQNEHFFARISRQNKTLGKLRG